MCVRTREHNSNWCITEVAFKTETEIIEHFEKNLLGLCLWGTCIHPICIYILGTALAEVYSLDVGCATDEFGLLFLNRHRKCHWIQHSDRLYHSLKYFLKSRISKTSDYTYVTMWAIRHLFHSLYFISSFKDLHWVLNISILHFLP